VIETFTRLDSRYVLDCKLIAQNGLHIGSGVAGTTTDAPFILQDEVAFVPGSSLRGVMRSTVERIVRTLAGDGQYCVLFEKPAAHCHRDKTSQEQEELGEALTFCGICQFFGCTGVAAKFRVSDATQCAAELKKPVRRDGVGINRDTETAEDKVKYDFEVLEKGAEFEFAMHLENVGTSDLAFLYILLKEMQQGAHLGGKKARGLGLVKLEVRKAQYFDNARNYGLKRYLAEGKMQQASWQDLETFLKNQFSEWSRTC
jgi:CRISPR-associated RAMP protein (TIGR02581 family)